MSFLVPRSALRAMLNRTPRISAAAALKAEMRCSISRGSKAQMSLLAARASSAPEDRFSALRSTKRFYSSGAPLGRKEIESRILEILKGFEKVDESKISPSATFTDDLGLDSLDAVEVVMAIEEEFSIEIPDKEADEIKSINQAIEYVSKSTEVVISLHSRLVLDSLVSTAKQGGIPV